MLQSVAWAVHEVCKAGIMSTTLAALLVLQHVTVPDMCLADAKVRKQASWLSQGRDAGCQGSFKSREGNA